ncbi:hypothetical protein ACOMHN_024956 [Nucella lapillus]
MAEGSQSSTSSKDANSDGPGFGMRSTIKVIRAKYSKVKDINTQTLQGWLHGPTEDRKVILMDCRDECEYAVSHLAGSQLVDWEHGDPELLLRSVPTDKPSTVVCYCSLGYRSSDLAGRLQKFLHSSGKGKTPGADHSIQVFNLEGSLFKWANEGRPMIDSNGQPTTKCHPYNAVWGKMLNKDLRSGL